MLSWEMTQPTYLHRLVYIGSHRFVESPTVYEFFESIVRNVNEKATDASLSGFLLYYARLFVHMVEGPEVLILRHLRRVYSCVEAGEERLGDMRVLIACHHIRQPFFTQWMGHTARPPTLLEDIDPLCSEEVTWRHIKTCLAKMYKLADHLNYQPAATLSHALDHLSETVPTLLPEFGLLKFLQHCKNLLDLREYLNVYLNGCTRKSYSELVWPIQKGDVPLHLLDPEQYRFLCDMDVMTT
ncbi:testis-expressed protein 47-like isoform X2 [Periplaneta americana]|uniref:testis-expressed protein 47-like isoform X2 n=1 Tax=Periplaneta americana TaxID=6978 RepID=UPI0037E985FE